MTVPSPDVFASLNDEPRAEVFVWHESRILSAREIRAEDYPLLAAIWDNDDDAIYDDM